MRLALPVLSLLLAACTALAPLPDVSGTDVVLLGEQHDAPHQPQLQQRWVATLAERGTLAALALEMTEQGASTAALPRDATEAQVREALHWQPRAWPWERYAPAVMTAVRAGVPVLGANLPQARQRTAMQDRTLDTLLGGPALKAQQQAIRRGHCGMLPESQVGPMTRIQVARDRAMAQTLAAAARPGRTVLLIAGAGHVQPDVGVPVHLPPALRVRALELPKEATGKDYCAEFRQQQRHMRPAE